ncbi:ClpP family protease [Sanyastnella coralliicola]|uniref:ClpP family protease n=1 Tax=Sanyastnella coralliicola TaxID=3069118 RepID=UPI0027BAC23E|nr:ATP-dependent Clp protease proteolytic subunit [Longitalea sp. SCSIO 12813]
MERAIRFMAPVNNKTADRLFKSVDELITKGTSHIHLLLSTPGGSVFHGLSLHNYLKGIPVPVSTYNFGSVDSIGVVIYCAGANRYVVPHSRFLIHSVKLNLKGGLSVDEKQIDEYLKSVKIDQHNIARVMSDTTGRSVESLESDMVNRTTLSPEQAVQYGLAHEIRQELIKPGMEMITIGEPVDGDKYQPRGVRFGK